MSAPASTTRYVRSAHLSRFEHGEYQYLYHDATGYILQMSEDVLGFLDRFTEPLSEEGAVQAFKGTYDSEEVRRFVSVFEQYRCLIKEGDDELEPLWRMFPVRAKWGVHRLDSATGDVHVYWREGGEVQSRRLTGWEAQLWQTLDGDTQLAAVFATIRASADLPDAEFRRAFLDLMRFLAHSTRQLLKLSEYPMSFYKSARSTPPYLLSHLPYRRAGAPASELDPQVERARRSIFSLLGRPNALLAGQPYGAALYRTLIDRRVLAEPPRRVLDLSMDLGAALATLVPLLPEDAEVWALARDDADRARYREAMGGYVGALRFLEGTPQRLPDLTTLGTFDLVLVQEVLGSLEHATVEQGKPKGEAARLDKAYDLFAGEAGDRFSVNVGALRLIETLPGLLAAGGKAVIVDYGEEFQRPVTSTTAETPYYLVHFGELKTVARRLGMSVFYGFLIDLLPFQRERFALSTSRSHVACLTRALADAGVTINPDYPYTAEELGPLTKGVEVGNIFYEKAEDRCQGVVPHQVKVLVLGVPDALEL